MSWFAKVNPLIDWISCLVQLDLDAEQHTIIATYTADLFSGIDLCNADYFFQLLSNPKSSATALAVCISHVEAFTSYFLRHVGTEHPSLSSWLSS